MTIEFTPLELIRQETVLKWGEGLCDIGIIVKNFLGFVGTRWATMEIENDDDRV